MTAKTCGTIKRQVEYRPVEGLIPYAANSRTHSDAQVAQIAASIREFGCEAFSALRAARNAKLAA